MKNSTTLLVIDPDTCDAVIADQAEHAFAQNTHMSVLIIGAPPILPTYAYGLPMYGSVPIPDNWAQIMTFARTALIERETQIKAVLGRSGVSADVQSLLCSTMDIKEITAQHARICDIAHVPTDVEGLSDAMRQATNGILFKSPIGLMLNASPSKPASCVFVAWDPAILRPKRSIVAQCRERPDCHHSTLAAAMRCAKTDQSFPHVSASPIHAQQTLVQGQDRRE